MLLESEKPLVALGGIDFGLKILQIRHYLFFQRVLTSIFFQEIDLGIKFISFGGPLCSIIMSPER